VSLVIHGHDQGWIPTTEGAGAEDVRRTWYTMRTEGEPALWTAVNPPGDPAIQSHTVKWDADTDVVRKIQKDKKIQVWAHARYYGWSNYVEKAELKITLKPQVSPSLAG